MARTLPDTKFYVPRPRESLVRRPRLLERLSQATRAKVTLISAPPGFGKTTLLAEWLAASASHDLIPVWVSLEPADNESFAFWSGVATAFHRAVPTAGKTIQMVNEPQPPPTKVVVTTLANELGSIGSDVLVVFDDFHVIDASDIQDQVSFLLEHLPPSAHVVIATRADPSFPLARLRAQGQLVEVRAVDPRFTRDEAAAYLNQAAGLDLAYASGLFPRALGVVLVVGGSAYLVDLTLALVAPDVSRQVHGLLAIPPTIAEVWTVLYLLVKGVRSSDGPTAATRRHVPAAA